jgi:DNA-binding transcriptional LysR family regulator
MALDGRIFSGVSVLAAVVEGGSFVKAAGLLGLTDSGVSRAIKRLETRLGVRLLDRTTRSVALTDEGRRFYGEVKSHLDAIEDAAAIASGATWFRRASISPSASVSQADRAWSHAN